VHYSDGGKWCKVECSITAIECHLQHAYVLFLTHSSSEPIWEEKKRWNRYKAVSHDLKALLEEEFKKVKHREGHGARKVVSIPSTDLRVSRSIGLLQEDVAYPDNTSMFCFC